MEIVWLQGREDDELSMFHPKLKALRSSLARRSKNGGTRDGRRRQQLVRHSSSNEGVSRSFRASRLSFAKRVKALCSGDAFYFKFGISELHFFFLHACGDVWLYLA